MWIARDDSGSLFAYNDKPYYDKRLKGYRPSKNARGDEYLTLPRTEFENITVENSPVEIKEITL